MEFHEDFHKACNFQYALITYAGFYASTVLNDNQYLQKLGDEVFTAIRENEVIGFRSNGSTVERRYYTE